MPNAARVGDKDSADHPIKKGSTDVFTNGLPSARVGDPDSADKPIVVGSPNVFVNG